MESHVKHYRKLPDGSLAFVGVETYRLTDCPTSSEVGVMRDVRSGGRRDVVLARPKSAGRPADPLKADLGIGPDAADVERRIAEIQYNGDVNRDDK